MNYKIAIELLELEKNFTCKELRKAYYKKCLMYHPDKNPSGEQMFRKIRESYEYLQNNNGNSYNSNSSYETYSEIFKKYMYSMKPDIFDKYELDNTIDIVMKLSRNIIDNSEDVAIDVIEKLDEETCNKIYQYINNYKNIFNISSSFLIKMRESINRRFEMKPIIVLKPQINDLISANIFIYDNNLKNENIKYYVPLWHHELYFKHHIFHIHPTLPSYIQIDCDNNIIIHKSITAKELIQKDNIEIYIEDKLFVVHRSDIKLIEYQNIKIENSGIPKINEKDIFDVSKKGDIIIYLNIEF